MNIFFIGKNGILNPLEILLIQKYIHYFSFTSKSICSHLGLYIICIINLESSVKVFLQVGHYIELLLQQ